MHFSFFPDWQPSPLPFPRINTFNNSLTMHYLMTKPKHHRYQTLPLQTSPTHHFLIDNTLTALICRVSSLLKDDCLDKDLLLLHWLKFTVKNNQLCFLSNVREYRTINLNVTIELLKINFCKITKWSNNTNFLLGVKLVSNSQRSLQKEADSQYC